MTIQAADRIEFDGALGHRLSARLEQPAGQVAGFALFALLYLFQRSQGDAADQPRALAEQGLAVLRFDFTGLGESEGDFAETNFSSNIDDLVAAADFLRAEYQAPQLLIGHSLGGTAVLMAALRIDEVQAVATIAAPSDTEHLRDLLVQKSSFDEHSTTAEIELAGRTFTVKRQLLDDLAEQSVRDAIAELRRPLLIFHSPLDKIVGIDHARRIFEAAKHPKSFVSLDSADHLLLDDEADADFVGHLLAIWAKRYFVDAEPAAGQPTLEHGQVLVTGGRSGLLQRVTAGPHHFVADEPEDHGGTDAGPTPYELLLASLGTCTAMTLRMYADRKGWPLHQASVRLAHARIHAKDCEECDTQEGKIDRMERVLELEGDLSDEQRQRLLEIADRCPVSRTLTTETKVATRLG